MGNYCYSCYSYCSNHNVKFIDSIVIDPKNNIAIGIYYSEFNKISQCIVIGNKTHLQKYNFLFASLHKNFNMVLLNFENNIILKIFLDSDDGKVKYKLINGNDKIINIIDPIVLNKIKYIDFNDSTNFDINIIVCFIEHIKNHNYIY